jgi:hypothetical protein
MLQEVSSKRVLATLGKFVIGCHWLLATLQQIPQRILATFSNSIYLPEGRHIDYLPEQLSEGIG